MDWRNLRGRALNIPKKKKLDLFKLDFRIIYVVNKEFEEFIDQLNIKNNKYGEWINI